jgi:hypothetical protein
VYLTRDELATQAALEKKGNPLAYAIMYAELEAVIVSGPRRGKQFTYALLDERVPASTHSDDASSAMRTRDEALAELARRYVASHGPAQTKDLAWWSGVTTADAGRAFELANVARFEIGGVEYWHAPPARRVSIANPHVRLLPNYDELLVAFADRSPARDPRAANIDKAAIFRHFVASNGRLIGGYRCTKEKRGTVLACTLVVTPTAAELDALDAEVIRYGSFIDQPVRLELTTPKQARTRRS